MSELLGIGSRVNHPSYGTGVVTKLHGAAYDVVFTMHGKKLVGKEYSDWEVVERIEPQESVTFNAAEKSLLKILREYNGIESTVDLGDKWIDGTLILQPGEDGLKSKEIPIDTFFHKIVMVRDRLRIIEQRVNSSGLKDEEKVNLQQYITRIYGSLTSFNILFKHREDHFKGESTK